MKNRFNKQRTAKRDQGAFPLLRSGVAVFLALAAMQGMAADAGRASAARGEGAISKNSLFEDDDDPVSAAKPSAPKAAASESGLKGYVQFELARTVAEPEHWSKMKTRAEINSRGTLGEGVKWKLGARLDYDAVYDTTSFYSSEVARNQRFNLSLRENYLDFSRGNWDFRLGKQHVVWGEMVGMFFADVVSARDMREFILPEFEMLRIPQWAARAEYFKDDFHAELLWIPVASYDLIGKPSAEFYPYQPVFPGFNAVYRQEARPANNLSHGNYGLRLSMLKNGWDVSGFYYNSMDTNPTFYREIVGSNMVFQARHNRIQQAGGTVAKDLGSVVFKGEAVYTQGRRFGVMRLDDPDGVVRQNTLDWAVGLDFALPAETRFNVQYFQRKFFNHDSSIIPDKNENGYSLLLAGKLSGTVEAQALWISSFNREDWLFRPRLTWAFEKNWRLMLGADVFKGPALGLFGQYDNKDRVYAEIRYSF